MLVLFRTDKQARTKTWSKGSGSNKLGIIVVTIALVSIGPGPVKHVFAPAIRFQVQGHHCRRYLIIVTSHQHMMWLPAALGGSTTGFFQAVEKLIAHEWIVRARQLIPVFLANLFY